MLSKIEPIGLGTNFVTDVKKDEKKLVYLIQKALDCGINLFDTAEIYHNGYSEKLIGKAFKKNRKKAFIATKFSTEHSSYKDVLKAAKGSLKRLKTDYIDLYQIHWPDGLTPIDDTLCELMKLRDEGKLRWLGVSNFSSALIIISIIGIILI